MTVPTALLALTGLGTLLAAVLTGVRLSTSVRKLPVRVRRFVLTPDSVSDADAERFGRKPAR